MSSPQDPLVVPYSDLNAFTIDLTDGVRARKTPVGFVVEKLLSDGVTWVDVGTVSPYLAANTARVDPSGDDSTGVVGNILQPFKTVQGAITALEALPAINYALILIPHNYVPGDPITTSLVNIQFQGTSENDSVEDLVLTANACALLFCNCDSGNITGNCPGGLDVKIDLSAELGGLPGTLTNTGNIRIVSSGGGLATSTVSCPGFAISMQGVNWGREDQGITIDSAGSDVTAVQCVIEDVLAAASITLKDSRLKANTSGVVPVYQDLLLSRYDSTNTARVDAYGDDSTAKVGDLTKPFLTVQAALDACAALPPLPAGFPYVIDVGINQFTEDLTTSLRFLVFKGAGLYPISSQCFNNLTASSGPYTRIALEDTQATSVTVTNGDLQLLLSGVVDLDHCSATNGNVSVVSGNGSFITGVISASGNVQLDGFASSSNSIAISAGGNVALFNSLIDSVSCVNLSLNDSRVKDASGVSGTITATDYLLNPALMDFSTLPQATSEPAIAVGAAWIDTTSGLNVVKVKLA